MSYLQFSQHFNLTLNLDKHADPVALKALLRSPFQDDRAIGHVSSFLVELGGMLMYEGAYGIFSLPDALDATRLCLTYFPEFSGYTIVIGRDWLGYLFAVDFSRLLDAIPTVIVFDVNTHDALTTGMSIEQFHNSAVVEDPITCFNLDLYTEWQQQHASVTSLSQIVGYTIPLSLGGTDDFTNMVITDLDVYWTLTGDIGVIE